MSGLESPFHAIAAQAPDDTPEIELNSATAVTSGGADFGDAVTKKSKKRTNVWTKPTSRKSAKKSNLKNSGVRPSDFKDDNVLLKPFQQEDDPTYPILLSKIYKAEKIELSADRLAASGSKGYRMVRATRGVVEGAWYFEIYVEKLGETGHTRLGWSTRRGDIQAPVGYDAHSYAYRDVDGSKVHAALREEYGEAYFDKDVIGFYINLPREAGFTRKAEEEVVGYKGQPYVIVADEPLKPVPGSEIVFFKNGVCQGVAFRDINDGSYFPAASLYTHPSQDYCKVVFNFGPDFKYPVTDLGDRPFPLPMCQASGPGDAGAGAVTTTQTEGVECADNGEGKQRMAPDSANRDEFGEATKTTQEEDVLKPVKKAPSQKKKEKAPKVRIGKPKAEESNSNHPEGKREIPFKGIKKATNLPGPGSTIMQSRKLDKDSPLHGRSSLQGSLKGITVPGLPPLNGSQRDIPESGPTSHKGSQTATTVPGLPSLKNGKKHLSATGSPITKGDTKAGTSHGLPSFRESAKDVSGAGLPSLKLSKSGTIPATGLSSLKRSKKDMTSLGLSIVKGSKKDIAGAVLPSGIVGKKDTSVTRLPSNKVSKKDVSGVGLSTTQGNKDIPGIGLSSSKRSKKDMTGIGSPHMSGIGSALLKASRNTGFGSMGLGSAALNGRRSWEDGIQGAMDVDVVVVESTSTFQDG